MQVLLVPTSVHALFWPLCPNFNFCVFPPPANAIIWFPRHIPNVGTDKLIKSLAVFIVDLHLLGYSGPLLITTPTGLYDKISLVEASQGTQITLNPILIMLRIMLYFTPVSINTTGGKEWLPYSLVSETETSGMKLKPSYLVSRIALSNSLLSILSGDTHNAPLITPSTLNRFVRSRVSIPLIPDIFSSYSH